MSHTIDEGEFVIATLAHGPVPAIAITSAAVGAPVQARLMADPSTVIEFSATLVPGIVNTIAKSPERVSFEERVEAADRRSLTDMVPVTLGADPDNSLWSPIGFGLGVETRFAARRFVFGLPLNLDHFGRPPVGVTVRVRGGGAVGVLDAVMTATMWRLPADQSTLSPWSFEGDPPPPPAAVTGIDTGPAQQIPLLFPVGVNAVAASNFPCRAVVEVVTGNTNLPPATPYQIISYWPVYQ